MKLNVTFIGEKAFTKMHKLEEAIALDYRNGWEVAEPAFASRPVKN